MVIAFDRVLEKIDGLIANSDIEHRDDSTPRMCLLLAIKENPTTQEVVRLCRVLMQSQSVYDRMVACEILGALSVEPVDDVYSNAIYEMLCSLVEDSDVEVAGVAVMMLGQSGIDGVEGLLIRVGGHQSPYLRARAASVLWIHPTTAALCALTRLARDDDSSVRAWAVMAIGATSIETPELEAVLLASTKDQVDEVRGEAFRALADRNHPQIVPLLVDYFRSSDQVGRMAVVAAESIGISDLYDALLELKGWWDLDPSMLAEALESCSPARSRP